MVTVKSVWVVVTVLAWVFLIAHLGHCSKLYVASPMNPLYHCSECSKTPITTALHKYPSKASQILWPEVQTLDYQRPWLLVSSLASPLSTQLPTPASTISFPCLSVLTPAHPIPTPRSLEFLFTFVHAVPTTQSSLSHFFVFSSPWFNSILLFPKKLSLASSSWVTTEPGMQW